MAIGTQGISAYRYVASPIGKLLIAGDGEIVRIISFPTGKTTIIPEAGWRNDDTAFCKCVNQLQEYFAGKRQQFSFAIEFKGTPFQELVWQALCKIPYGHTQSYGDIAARIGRQKAVRAVGAANGANPLPIIIPCHRVIGADLSLTGFGGGLETKKMLLNLENAKNVQGELF